MKKLSEVYTEMGVAFTFPIEIENASGKRTYYENYDYGWKREYDDNDNETSIETSGGFWWRREYDDNGNQTYSETSGGYWSKSEYDANGNQIYYENSEGYQKGNPPAEIKEEEELVELRKDRERLEYLINNAYVQLYVTKEPWRRHPLNHKASARSDIDAKMKEEA